MAETYSVTPDDIAVTLVHVASKAMQQAQRDLAKYVTKPQGWLVVHEEFLLLLYCLTLSRFTRRFSRPEGAEIADRVAALIAATSSAGTPLSTRLAEFFRPTQQLGRIATRCFVDQTRVHRAVEDYVVKVEARFAEIKLTHRFFQTEAWGVPVFQARLIDCLGVPNELELDVLQALAILSAAVTGTLTASDEWELHRS